MRKGFLWISLLMAVPAISHLADDIRLGEPEYGGSGCPAGSAGVALSPDGKALSILFDSFVVEAGGGAGRPFDRKNCDIAVPVHVPEGLSISIFQIDYRGFNSLPYGAYSRFNVEYFFAGSAGPRYERRFDGPIEDEFLLRNTRVATVWSPCGESVILRASTGMLVRTSANRSALSSLDSIDLSAGLVFSLNWRNCNSDAP